MKNKPKANALYLYPNNVIDEVFHTTSEGIMITDENMQIILVNSAFEKLTGYTMEEVQGKNPRFLQSGKQDALFYNQMWQDLNNAGFWRSEIWNKRKSGEIYPEILTIKSIKESQGMILNYIGVFSDISRKKTVEKELEELTLLDTLTNITNRNSFSEQFNEILSNSKHNDDMHALLFIDLDRFKQINETFGNDIGDQLLIEVTNRINSLVKPTDLFARYGGDEFLFALTNIPHQKEAVQSSKDIIKVLNKPYMVDGSEIYITSSIGISIYPQDGLDTENLIHKADKAMYFAKQNGRNNYAFYFDDLKKDSARLLLLESELRKALQNKDFTMHYQPKVSIHTEQIIGVEALVRWTSDRLGIVSPGEFIPVAEDSGLIIPLSEIIIEKVCQDINSWRNKGIDQLLVSVNIAGLHFQQEDFIERISNILKKYNCSPEVFEMELTERTLMKDSSEIVNKLVRLKNMGFKISIDDFGTGYSSLSYLNRFPLNYLKIDGSFIQQMTSLQEKQAVVDCIIMMAHRLHIKVVAEGVESKEQVELLKSMDCDFIQGYYFSKPLPSEELVYFLELWEIHKQERNV
ncbi:diguanylate cyclase/phosphodiesterase with PAS/PAC sensor(s) [Psychrobacillus insolitus]|uniref:Diguanylate cyclase/phosphodiesterase with PAS/PAC sensor(S) n=1 Tax=Psychrobacillus insolitus TaxID=1461 RepID=A0A2W7MMD0_9BACI|nr:GGDEF domain-containing phosphodiesterase [Psychrobacillus insolitus]PZX07668.1 diguanylate cyclase/phosphodiesterase with PAS/PAC sensor(s) [Psychrobacillus insolitus]